MWYTDAVLTHHNLYHSQGVAWSDVYAGRYYPTLSLYKGATVSYHYVAD